MHEKRLPQAHKKVCDENEAKKKRHVCKNIIDGRREHERMPLNSHWLVLRIGGADFLHCWVADSVRLECAESLITK